MRADTLLLAAQRKEPKGLRGRRFAWPEAGVQLPGPLLD